MLCQYAAVMTAETYTRLLDAARHKGIAFVAMVTPATHFRHYKTQDGQVIYAFKMVDAEWDLNNPACQFLLDFMENENHHCNFMCINEDRIDEIFIINNQKLWSYMNLVREIVLA